MRWKRCVCVFYDWFLTDLILPPESTLLHILHAPSPFQGLNNNVPSLVTWNQTLSQNAVAFEGSYRSLPPDARPWHTCIICIYPLHLGSVSAAPFQDHPILSDQPIPAFCKPSLICFSLKVLVLVVCYSFDICHTTNNLMTFLVWSIATPKSLEGKE